MIPYHEILSRLPIESIEPLDGLCVRFCYPRAREIPLHWTIVLETEPQTAQLEPEVTDRATVADRLEGLRHALYQSFEQGQGSALFETMGIVDPARWRDVLLDHYCRPQWLYTNGKAAFSLVERQGPRFEVARLPSLASLHEFRTLDVRTLLDPREVVEFGHQDGAEAHVLEHLSQVTVRMLTLRDGLERRILLLQDCGVRPGGPERADITLMIAHVAGRSYLLQMQPDRCDAYTVLNDLPDLLEQGVAEACATCSGFRFSGTSRDSSGGTRGFCRRRLEAARASGLPMPGLDVRPRYGTTVSVFDRCRSYEMIDDEEREVPFCQAGEIEG